MSERFMWQELKKLIVIDHEITTVRKELSSIDASIQSERQKLPLLKENAERLAGRIKELQKNIDILEIDSKKIKADEVRKKEQLDTIIGPKEYSALEKELANLERSLGNITSEQVNHLEEQEKLSDELTAMEANIACESARLTEWESVEGVKQSALGQKLATLENDWAKQNKKVPVELGAGYIEMRNRVADPVVPVVTQSCSSCFYSLLHQDIVALTKKTIIRCRGCYRFLFIPEEQEVTPDTSKG